MLSLYAECVGIHARKKGGTSRFEARKLVIGGKDPKKLRSSSVCSFAQSSLTETLVLVGLYATLLLHLVGPKTTFACQTG